LSPAESSPTAFRRWLDAFVVLPDRIKLPLAVLIALLIHALVLLLIMLLAALLPCRRHFYRHSAFAAERFSAGWITAVLLVLVSSIWLGLFAHKHVEFSHELWWQFALDADAPRFLRASVGVLAAVALFAFSRLLRPAKPEPQPPTLVDLDRACGLVSAARESYAHLALVGDKRLLFSASGQGLLMYATESRSWVAMGDPLGPEADRVELAWRFRELADPHDGWTVFYQASPDYLPLYLDLGLSPLKIGEEAVIDLTAWDLADRRHKHLRQALPRRNDQGRGRGGQRRASEQAGKHARPRGAQHLPHSSSAQAQPSRATSALAAAGPQPPAA